MLKRFLQSKTISEKSHTKNMPDSNIVVISSYKCTDDKCDEPTKKRTGWGTKYQDYGNGVLLRKHFNSYTCDNPSCTRHSECTGTRQLVAVH